MVKRPKVEVESPKLLTEFNVKFFIAAYMHGLSLFGPSAEKLATLVSCGGWIWAKFQTFHQYQLDFKTCMNLSKSDMPCLR